MVNYLLPDSKKSICQCIIWHFFNELPAEDIRVLYLILAAINDVILDDIMLNDGSRSVSKDVRLLVLCWLGLLGQN